MQISGCSISAAGGSSFLFSHYELPRILFVFRNFIKRKKKERKAGRKWGYRCGARAKQTSLNNTFSVQLTRCRASHPARIRIHEVGEILPLSGPEYKRGGSLWGGFARIPFLLLLTRVEMSRQSMFPRGAPHTHSLAAHMRRLMISLYLDYCWFL